MATLSVNKTYADASTPDASDFNTFNNSIEEFLNDIGLNDDNIQTTGITASDKFQSISVTTAKIAADAVTTAKIAADAVDGTKIPDDAILTEHYTDGSIDNEHLADSSITTAKIADSTIGLSQILNSNVTQAKRSSVNFITGNSIATTTHTQIAFERETSQITCGLDTAGSLNQKHFVIYDTDGSVGVWIDVDDSGSTAPAGALACNRQLEVTGVIAGDDSTAVAVAIAAALDADDRFSATNSTNVVTAIDANPGIRTNVVDGDTGFGFATPTGGAASFKAAITTIGRPVLVGLQANDTNPGYVGASGGTVGTSTLMYIRCLRDTTVIGTTQIEIDETSTTSGNIKIPPGSILFFDAPTAGDHEYYIEFYVNDAESGESNYCEIVALELP